MKKISSGIMIDEMFRILLIKRKYNKKGNPNTWSIVGGGQEGNEKSKEIVIREVKEEVGLDFIPEKLYSKEEKGNLIFYRYLGKYSGKIIIQEEECDGYGWFHFDEAIKLNLLDDMFFLLNKLKNDNLLK